jgi:hypothetical protein
VRDIADTQLHEITGSKLAIDCKVHDGTPVGKSWTSVYVTCMGGRNPERSVSFPDSGRCGEKKRTVAQPKLNYQPSP